MARITEYDSQSGRIGGTLFADDEDVLQSMRDVANYDAALDGQWPGDAYYVDNGQPTPRPIMAITTTGATLTGLPIPATVIIGADRYEVDDGDVELDFPLPGTYRVRVEAWPYQDWETEVTA